MAQEESIKEKVNAFLKEDNHFTRGLAFIEDKTGVNRLYLFGGCVLFLACYLIFGYASGFVVAILGFLYPAYASVKAIESSNKEDDTQWLTYWVVYAAFSIAEFFSDIFLGWFPLYFLFKCAFLCWCMAPFSWNGANFLYTRFIAPFVLKHEKEVDQYIKKGTAFADDLAHKAQAEATAIATEQIIKSQTTPAEPESDKKED